jgi:UDP-GlcNAc:undecaprenyl-phosphate/decaprenyl-phosphate GlcNAc-1-phosphate transferase
MNWNIILASAIGAVVAFASVRWIYFRILKIAYVKGLVDNPDARKLQTKPVPLVGGLAVYFGLLFGMMLVTAISKAIVPDDVHDCLFPVFTAITVMLYVGAMDDILGLTPRTRLLIEVGAILCLVFSSGMCIDTFRGLWGIGDFSWWIAVPLTVFAGVGIINAVNMIDGVNGLSSGLCITCCVLFGIAFVRAQDVPNAVLSFTMAAALIPFYIHNVFGSKSRMFIGDAGTMMMGMLITWFLVCLLSRENHVAYYDEATRVNIIAFVLAVMSVPVFDTLRVMTMRMVKGKSPFRPDKTHLHHAFVNVGVSHFITSTTEILISLAITGIWALSVVFGASIDVQLYVVIASAVVFVWGLYAFLHYHSTHHTELMHKLSGLSVRTQLGRSSWWKAIQKYLDKPVDYSINNPAVEASAEDEAEEDEKDVADLNFKEKDRRLILGYMKGKAEVHVDDLMANSGAESLRVYPLIFEEEMVGNVVIVKANPWGSPEIVALRSEA